MRCFYLVCNHTNIDNHWTYNDQVGYGVFADREAAQSDADRLNKKSEKEWDDRCSRVRSETIKRQARWDVLHEHGLSEGRRPSDPDPYYTQKWEPGLDDISYYSVEETEFFPSNGSMNGDE